ncbi:MAG: hypothetical protein K2W85_13730, partial [Phycisphaerales bacterium]|nr:hypothetical protein [Phycisphaerales bacterium]
MMQDASSATAHALTLRQLADLHQQHASKYYRRRDGRPSGEADNLRAVMKRFVAFAGEASPASKINRHQVRAWMDQLAAEKLARTYINTCLRKLRTITRWAADLDYVPTSIIEDLRLVKSLQPGRSAARESAKPKPPPIDNFTRVMPFLPDWARAVCQLSMLTAARPSELLELTNAEVHIDDLPRLTPAQHKNAHRGHNRVIPLCPTAVGIVDAFWRPLLPVDFIFPSDRSKHGHRTINGYEQALRRACRLAGVPHLRPYDARRRVAIETRSKLGLDAA